MPKAMLIDTTRCIGCRGCQVACKSWNDLPAAKTSFSPTGGNPPRLDANNFTRVLFAESAAPDGGTRWSFVKRQCMHCREPACASVCPVGALEKTASGPVVYRDDRCIGCRVCMLACPFNVPKFEWTARVPYIRKCTFCADRQAIGMKPSCAATCPSGAITFGDREELLREAHGRIDGDRSRYFGTIYGEHTGGGTSMIYLTAAPFEQLGIVHEGFRGDLGDLPHGRPGLEWNAKVPYVAAGVGGLALALYHLNKRRAEVEAAEGKER
jgi:formate dehydrogenase iron-sulfur subunit